MHVLEQVPKALKHPLHSLKRQLTRRLSHVNNPVTVTGCPTELYKRLCACPRDVPKFDLSGQELWGRVWACHDSDTVKVVIEWGGTLYVLTVRLAGIDAPEMNTKNLKEKQLSIMSRDRLAVWALPEHCTMGSAYTEKQLKQLLMEHPSIVYIRCAQTDKYGRTLCKLYKSPEDSDSINDILLQENFVDSYDGGTKLRSWDSGEA